LKKKEGEFMKVLDIIVTALLFIGALNWGLVGFFEYNLVGAIFGEATAYARVIYAAIGLCGLYEAYNFTIGSKSLYHRWCELPAVAKY
jgi:uncharacterized protein